jgi:hypothetical protein
MELHGEAEPVAIMDGFADALAGVRMFAAAIAT